MKLQWIGKKCDFDQFVDQEQAKPVYLGSNRWHLAFARETKMHVTCDNMRSNLLSIVGNKILNLHAGCTATVGRHKIRSTVSHNQTFSIADHKERLDLHQISKAKLEFALQDLGFEKQKTMDFASDFNETNQLHLNTETLKNNLKVRQREWEERHLTNSFRADMQADLEASQKYIYILAGAGGGAFAILILLLVARHYIKKYVHKGAQRTTKQVGNEEKSLQLVHQRSYALEQS